MDKGTILIASDHNGNTCRDHLRPILTGWGYNPVDLGPRTDKHRLGVKKVDYTDYAEQVGYAISKNGGLLGILICGTGVGMSIAANRFDGVYASLVGDENTAKKTRAHNKSNVLVMGSWNTPIPLQEKILAAWLNEEFEKGRHEKRVAKLASTNPEDVVLVPGVFELVHPGHLRLLEFAKTLGRVVVALNTDESAEKVKGRRPKIAQDDRRRIIQGLECVDEVIFMSDTCAGELIKSTNARYVVKGGQPVEEQGVRAIDRVPDDVEVKLFPVDVQWLSRDIVARFSDAKTSS